MTTYLANEILELEAPSQSVEPAVKQDSDEAHTLIELSDDELLTKFDDELAAIDRLVEGD